MKFLILALCVYAASAASFGYNPYQPTKQENKAFAQAVVTPVASVPFVAAKTYRPSQFSVPVTAVKSTYGATKFGVSASAVATKATYKPTQYEVPIPAAKVTYDASKIVATAPIAAVKNTYNTGKEAEAAILRSDSDVGIDGYTYNFETANGIASQASGILKKVDDAEVIVSQGAFQYTAPDGTPVEISYVADENGYQPRGDLLPVPPPVPEAILRSLEYIRTHPQKSENY